MYEHLFYMHVHQVVGLYACTFAAALREGYWLQVHIHQCARTFIQFL